MPTPDDLAASTSKPIARALVVHGDNTTRRLCRRVLEESGYMTSETDSGVGAVATVREVVPDLIIIDDQLRDVPGWQAAAWLRSLPALRSTTIVILGSEPGSTDERPAAQVTAWLPKPFSARALRRAIETTLARSLAPLGDDDPATDRCPSA
jgi:CheY-like chemotaxis protein